ncbi:MAG: glycosyltransferase family 2 protein [bacterium]
MDSIDSIPGIRFIIIYFFYGKLDRSSLSKVLRCLNKQTLINHDFVVASGDISHLAAGLDKKKYSHACFIEQNDLIAGHALSSLAQAIQADSSIELIFSDEDTINRFGIRVSPYFKPQYAPLLLMSHNYMNAFLCLKLTDQVVQEIKDAGRIDQSSLYRLVLHIMRKGARSQRIADVLYHRHWKNADKLEDTSTKDIIHDEINARHFNARILNYEIPGFNQLAFYPQGSPKISIIIPFKDKVTLLKSCIQSIEAKSTYHNYEIILIDNRSEERETFEYLKSIRHRVMKADIDFNYSKLNNMGAQAAEGEYLLLLNNDTEVIASDWMETLLGLAQRPEVGAVGAKLIYPDHTIQHAGVVIGKGEPHINKFLSAYRGGYKHYNNLIREYSGVAGACLMVSKEKYQEVGGLTECLAVEGNDVDLCYKLLKAGYHTVYNPHCILYHHEAASRKGKFKSETRKECIYIQQVWSEIYTNDPFYNPNFSHQQADFCARID